MVIMIILALSIIDGEYRQVHTQTFDTIEQCELAREHIVHLEDELEAKLQLEVNQHKYPRTFIIRCVEL